MNTEIFRNTFNRGLDQDTNLIQYNNQSVFNAENIRIVSKGTLDQGAIVNVPGNRNKIQLPTNSTIVGHTNVRDTLVLFLAVGASAPYESQIVRVEIDDTNTLQTTTLVYSDSSSTTKLNFTPTTSVSTVGRYETENIQKVYWSDGTELLRSINIVNDNTGIQVDNLNVVPNFSQSPIRIDSVEEGGRHKAGKIQYAYRLSALNGATSFFSAATGLVALNNSTFSDTDFLGNDLDDDVNKSVRVSIDNIDTAFEYVNIYSIFYSSINQVPQIRLVAEIEIPTGQTSISFLDTGSVISTITIEEFNSLGGRVFAADYLESRKNILFAGGITEDQFEIDLDCRAYRFRTSPSTHALIVEDSDASVTPALGYYVYPNGNWEYRNFTASTIIDSGTNWEVPETANVINQVNDVYNTNIETIPDNSKTIYQSDGVTLGGTGKIVSYRFVNNIIDDVYNIDGVDISPSEEAKLLTTTSHKRDEVYRYGIVFFNSRGQKSFVKWIGDVRIPNETSGERTYKTDGTTNNVSLVNVDIEFTVNFAAIPADIRSQISGFQIVRVERTRADRSVIAQGVAIPSATDNRATPIALSLRADLKAGVDATNDIGRKVIGFFSPETFMGGLTLQGTAYRLKYVGFVSNFGIRSYTGADINFGDRNAAASSAVFYPDATYPEVSVVREDLYKTSDLVDLKNLSILPSDPENGPQNILTTRLTSGGTGSAVYRHAVASDGSGTEGAFSFAPTGTILSLETAITGMFLDTGSLAAAKEFPIVDLLVDNYTSRYGGLTYQSRIYNTYVPASEFVKSGTGNVTSTAKGDIYVSVYEQFTSLIDPAAETSSDNVDRRQRVAIVPIESSVNYLLANQKPARLALLPGFSRIVLSFGSVTFTNTPALLETTAAGIQAYPESYPSDLKDFNSYNTVYSAVPRYPQFFVEDPQFRPVEKLDTTIIASEIKTNGEIVDNWTRFLFANTLEVESDKGSLMGLLERADRLFFFQENGFGTVAVQDREVVTGSTGIPTTLGTGAILERFDYISTSIGIVNENHLIPTSDAFYLYNHARRNLYSFSGQLREISLEGNMSSYFDNLSTAHSLGLIGGYDFRFQEALFAVGGKVLCYSEKLGRFTSFYTFDPSVFISLFENLLSVSKTGGNLFKHNIGDYSSFYGVVSNTVVEILIMPKAGQPCIFDNISYRSIVSDNTQKYDGDTFSTISFENDYQSPDPVNIASDDPNNVSPAIAKTFRVWRSPVPIEDLGDNYTSERMLDIYMKVTLTYPNTNNRKIKLYDLTSYFRPYTKGL